MSYTLKPETNGWPLCSFYLRSSNLPQIQHQLHLAFDTSLQSVFWTPDARETISEASPSE